MPNGRIGDEPLSDLTVHGINHFPPDIAAAMLRIEALGERDGRWAIGCTVYDLRPCELEWIANEATIALSN